MHKYENGEYVELTQAEIDANTQADLDRQAELAATDYIEKRRAAYASLADQLDMQYHDSVNGTTTWADHIASVKAAYPKP